MKPDEQPVMGLAEVADFIGVSRQAVANWRKQRREFPKPIAELHVGPIWSTPAIEEFRKFWRAAHGMRES